VLAFNDLNGNEVRETGEDLIAGALITVTDSLRQVVGSYLTNGWAEPHCFLITVPGIYYVREQNPPGWVSTSPDYWGLYVWEGAHWDVEFGDQLIGTATPTHTPTASPTPTISATPSRTPTPTSTATWTASPTATPTATRTSTSTPTRTPTSTATGTRAPTSTASPTGTATATATASPTPSPTPLAPQWMVQDPTAVDCLAPLEVLFPAPMVTDTVQFGFDPPIGFSVHWQGLGVIEHEPFSPGGEYRFWVRESRTVDGQTVAARHWSFRAAPRKWYLPMIMRSFLMMAGG